MYKQEDFYVLGFETFQKSAPKVERKRTFAPRIKRLFDVKKALQRPKKGQNTSLIPVYTKSVQCLPSSIITP